MRAWYEESVSAAGLQSRFAGVHTPEVGFSSVEGVQDELFDVLRELVERAAKDHGADVVILAGAPLAGLSGRIEGAAAVLVDPISAAICQAKALVRIAPGGAATRPFAARRRESRWSYRRRLQSACRFRSRQPCDRRVHGLVEMGMSVDTARCDEAPGGIGPGGARRHVQRRGKRNDAPVRDADVAVEGVACRRHTGAAHDMVHADHRSNMVATPARSIRP
jgi:hypothetical protein